MNKYDKERHMHTQNIANKLHKHKRKTDKQRQTVLIFTPSQRKRYFILYIPQRERENENIINTKCQKKEW